MSVAVEPEKILRELRDLWEQLGHDQEASGGVLRACAMTLLVVAEDEADAERARRTVGVLMHDHPCRAIVLRISDGVAVDARVFAECWMPYGRSQQICAEGVEITAGASQLWDVAQLLVPLVVPDLPVVLWCRGGHAFSPGAFDPLFPLAEKIVFDSGAAPDAGAAITALRAMKRRGLRMADLAWTRATGWREALANAFDDGVPRVTSVRVTHGGASPSTTARYFATWVQRALPSARVSLESAPGEPGLQAVTLAGDRDISITRADGSSVEVRSGERRCLSMLPPIDEDALMREELSILNADPVFDRVLA